MSIEELKSAMEHARVSIKNYKTGRARPVACSFGTVSVESFSKKLLERLGADAPKYPLVYKLCFDMAAMDQLLEKEFGPEAIELEVPDIYKTLVLNVDIGSPSRELPFFLTTQDEILSQISAASYMTLLGVDEETGMNQARKVIPKYLPRSERGISKQETISGESIEAFNSYIPPTWLSYEGDLPDKLPRLFEKLVKHLFPLEIEREYFYSWLHDSLFSRAYVYLILCGSPGVGKNRLKLVMRALHGFSNTVDGKKSTFTERFNSQFEACTLAWFDELKYGPDEENFMKEVQNDSISIERKGVDATRSTRIYSSSVISNNKPRDNYLAFDARKFSPLLLTSSRLEVSMTEAEIDDLTGKVEDWNSEKFDLKFVAQIGRWIKNHGRSSKWPTLEYKGPMFYRIAHTSLSRWQKKAIEILIEKRDITRAYVEGKGYLWSKVEYEANRKNKERSLQFPEYSTVKNLFDVFVDGTGNKCFEATYVSGDILGDFYVNPIKQEVKIFTEADILNENNLEDGGDLL